MISQRTLELIPLIDPDQLYELAEVFDGLTGYNVLRKGSGLELMIDEKCGRLEEGDNKFCEFIVDIVSRTP